MRKKQKVNHKKRYQLRKTKLDFSFLLYYNEFRGDDKMLYKEPIFVTNAVFFVTNTSKQKPIFVKDRDYYSLTYRHRGKVMIECQGQTLISEADSVTFMPKHLGYVSETLEDVEISAIHFDILGNGLPERPMVFPDVSATLRALFLSLTKNSETSSFLLQMSIFYEILSVLQGISEKSAERVVPKKIRMAQEKMVSSFSSPLLSIEGIADELNISTAYLRRTFKEIYGVSPLTFFKELRLSYAKQLLLTENEPIANIAQRCGYTSTSYFIQDFHKSVGESPSQYRKRLAVTP